MGVYRPSQQEGRNERNKDVKDKGPKPYLLRIPPRKARISEQVDRKSMDSCHGDT